MLIYLLFLKTILGLEFGFNLLEEEEQCYQDILRAQTVTIFRLNASNNNYRFRINHENEKLTMMDIEGKQEMQFDFTAPLSGKYYFCFAQGLENDNLIMLDYLAGTDIMDKTQIAQRKDLMDLDSQFGKIEDILNYMKSQLLVYSQITNNNDHLFVNMFKYSVYLDISIILIILGLGCIQIYIIKTIIKRKKNM